MQTEPTQALSLRLTLIPVIRMWWLIITTVTLAAGLYGFYVATTPYNYKHQLLVVIDSLYHDPRVAYADMLTQIDQPAGGFLAAGRGGRQVSVQLLQGDVVQVTSFTKSSKLSQDLAHELVNRAEADLQAALPDYNVILKYKKLLYDASLSKARQTTDTFEQRVLIERAGNLLADIAEIEFQKDTIQVLNILVEQQVTVPTYSHTRMATIVLAGLVVGVGIALVIGHRKRLFV